jgi:hypothetical protein
MKPVGVHPLQVGGDQHIDHRLYLLGGDMTGRQDILDPPSQHFFRENYVICFCGIFQLSAPPNMSFYLTLYNGNYTTHVDGRSI